MTGVAPNTGALADRDTVARAQSGDSSAFDTLFARHYSAVYNLALRLDGNRESASDIAQAAFIKAYGSLQSLRDGQAFLGWMYRIVVNLVRDRAKQRRRKPWVALMDLWRPERVADGGGEPMEFADSSLDPARVVAGAHLELDLTMAIQALPLEFREVVVLHHLRGMALDQIAEVLGIPVGTVKSRLGRARQRLRTAMAEWLDEGVEAV